FFFTCPPPTALSTLSLHDALPICAHLGRTRHGARRETRLEHVERVVPFAQSSPDLTHEVLHVRVALHLEQIRHAHAPEPGHAPQDRKSTRLNSSHSQISYAVFCLK